MFSDSLIARDFKCSRSKATAILKVIAQDVLSHQIVNILHDSKFFSLQVDETTDISITQQMAIMLRFFDNKLGRVQCCFLPWKVYKEPLESFSLRQLTSTFRILSHLSNRLGH